MILSPNLSLALGGKPPGGNTPSTLLNNLVYYLPMNEVSGTRVSLVGSPSATEGGGSTGSTTGLVYSLAANFPGGTFLQISPFTITTIAGLTLALWAKTSAAGYNFVFGTSTGYGAGNVQMGMYNTAPGGFFTTNAEGTDRATAANVTSNGSWHLIIGWFDPADGKNHIQGDNGTVFDSTAANAPVISASTCFLGQFGGGNFGAVGPVGPFAAWNRILTTTERTNYYNSGTGKPYPFA